MSKSEMSMMIRLVTQICLLLHDVLIVTLTPVCCSQVERGKGKGCSGLGWASGVVWRSSCSHRGIVDRLE